VFSGREKNATVGMGIEPGSPLFAQLFSPLRHHTQQADEETCYNKCCLNKILENCTRKECLTQIRFTGLEKISETKLSSLINCF
jgi:hypothetical protein